MLRLLKILMPVLMLGILAGVIVLLHHELQRYDYSEIAARLREIPLRQIGAALALTVVSYLLLIGYDALALRQIGRSPGLLRTAFVSFTAYVLSYNIGLAVISGTAVRFRLYSAWSYNAREIGQVVAFTSATFWLGLFAAAGGLLAFGEPLTLPHSMFGAHLRPLGYVLLATAVGYLVLCAIRRQPVTVFGWVLPLPRWPGALAQICLGALDVFVAGLVAWCVMPPGWALEHFMSVYLLGMTAGLISHVPGGLGVLETILLYGRPEHISGPAVLGAILVYRVIYYLLPLGVAVALLTGHEVHRHRERLQSASAFAGRWTPRVAPHVFAAMVFIAGVILLISGATPTLHGRLTALQELLPLPVLEVSHLLSSVVGLLLLFLARGLQRRLNGAYVLTITLLGAGAVFSLLKGADWQEAFVLTAMLGLLLPCRDYFRRRSSFIEARFTPGWVVAIVAVIAGSCWLGYFAYRHVEYRNDLWWQFALRGEAPRFLRASVAVMVIASVLGLRRLLRPERYVAPLPDPAALQRARAIVAQSADPHAHLSLIGHKPLLFSESGRSFIAYVPEGRNWIAVGDPIGSPTEFEELAWNFRELADQHGGWTVFYEVGPGQLALYLDLGLALTKLGDEARIPLNGFRQVEARDASVAAALARGETAGARFEWREPDETEPHLRELQGLAAEWQRTPNERSFARRFLDQAHVGTLPTAIVRLDGRVLAFALVSCTAGQELAVDLLRIAPNAPDGTMEYLLARLMQHGATHGYAWLNLGVAPVGEGAPTLGPVQRRVAAHVFAHGQRFYRVQGLRAFAEQFSPVWSPRYLASPGGLALPLVLASLARLTDRGPR